MIAKYVLIRRDPVYFNEYVHSMHISAHDALEYAISQGFRFFRIDLYKPYRGMNE